MTKQVDCPLPGFYRTRLVRGALVVPVLIYRGQPRLDGEKLDRSPRLCVMVNGRTDRKEIDEAGDYIGRVPLDPLEVWPFAEPISRREYSFLSRRRRWAELHQPEHPAALPHQAVDVRQLRPGW